MVTDVVVEHTGGCGEPDQASRGVHHDDGCQRREDQRGAHVRQPPDGGGRPLRGRQDPQEGREHQREVGTLHSLQNFSFLPFL